jgi:hypothetical protein
LTCIYCFSWLSPEDCKDLMLPDKVTDNWQCQQMIWGCPVLSKSIEMLVYHCLIQACLSAAPIWRKWIWGSWQTGMQFYSSI